MLNGYAGRLATDYEFKPASPVVWVVQCTDPYQNSNIIGVFSKEEEANKAFEGWETQINCVVYPMKIDTVYSLTTGEPLDD